MHIRIFHTFDVRMFHKVSCCVRFGPVLLHLLFIGQHLGCYCMAELVFHILVWHHNMAPLAPLARLLGQGCVEAGLHPVLT